MAQRRMFSPDIICSEEFLDMPVSARDLYCQLCIRADDDGFIQPRMTMRMVGASADDLKVLLAKRFLLTFESGVVVVKHWLIHNMIRTDRYHPTRFQEEKSQIKLKENKAYTELATNGLQSGNQMVPQVRVGKVKLGKVRLITDTLPSQIEILDDKETITKLQEKYPTLNVLEEIEKMKDWVSASGKRKKDYIAFARIWLRKTQSETKKIKSNDRTNL